MISKEKISGLTPEYEALIKLEHPNKQFPENEDEIIEALSKSGYIKKKDGEFVFTKAGKRKVIELQQKIETTNYNLMSVTGAAGLVISSSILHMIESFFILLVLFIFVVFLALIQMMRSTIWSNVS